MSGGLAAVKAAIEWGDTCREGQAYKLRACTATQIYEGYFYMDGNVLVFDSSDGVPPTFVNADAIVSLTVEW